MTPSQGISLILGAALVTLGFFAYREHDQRVADAALFKEREAQWAARTDSLQHRIGELQHEADSLSKAILDQQPSLAALLARVTVLRQWQLAHRAGPVPGVVPGVQQSPDSGGHPADTGVAQPPGLGDADSAAALGAATDSVVATCSAVLQGCGQLALLNQRLKFKYDSLELANTGEHDRLTAKIQSDQRAATRDKLIWGAVGGLVGYAVGHVH